MNFVETTHRDTAPKVEALPEQIPVVSVTYQVDPSQDPFARSNVFGTPEAQVIAEPEPDPLEPDADRTPEFLEQFPLDALQMFGTRSCRIRHSSARLMEKSTVSWWDSIWVRITARLSPSTHQRVCSRSRNAIGGSLADGSFVQVKCGPADNRP